MKKTRFALLQSAIALMLCFSMLLGTTYAWFTDSVTSAENHIIAGNLDVELEYSKDFENWNTVNSQTNIFDLTYWEPGHTEVVYLKVVNAGNLALKYRLGVNIVSETGSRNQAGESFLLSDYIMFGAVKDVAAAYADRNAARAAVTSARKIAAGFETTGSILNNGDDQYVALVVYMPEDVGNVANHATGEKAPEIKLGVNLYATQEMDESDTFDEEYDNNAAADFFPGFQGGSAGTVVSADDQGVTTAAAEMAGGDVSAVIPAGVLLADGKTSLGLSVVTKESSDANIQLGENEEMRPLDVHMEGVAENNTVPMLITLKHYLTTGINTGALKLYHVENGVTVAMTQVANPVNHNEFSYDPLTGDVTLALASFSEVAVVADTTNTWNGKAASDFAKGTGTKEDPYVIANADQLAFFRDVVDGKVEGWTEKTTFEGKYVQLENHIYLSNVLFDPIGWGYENAAWNRGGVEGKVFKGTFDGGKYDESGKLIGQYTIFDLKQNGWDLDPDKENYSNYTYTNCGFGLFAAAANATFKNLTIYGADVVVECVETGILVGLSQGSCTYENIQIHNSKVANYQRPTGGLIGEVSPLNGGGETKITNVVIGSDVVVGSLWGDFDAPCGGVIGARWDDTNKTTVVMKDVTVGCRMDVYSDVTSAYQWYAYRRAGMLIGNTEMTDPSNQHLADAPFLTCLRDENGNKTVKVYYGDWAAYHYCQFTNQDNSWCNNYPWVRVEAGENCSAYSNPRYGQPVINGVAVVGEPHTCTGEHNMELRFNQLYGGGQGVYGQPAHDGVEVINYRYSITYVNDYQVLAIKYVTESGAVSTANSAAQDLVVKWANENIGEGKFEFGGWMNAGSTKLTEIDKDNTKDIVLYPYFNNPYTARFVDQQGNVVAYCFFHEENLNKLDATKDAATAALPDLGDDLEFDYWEVQKTDNNGKVVEKKEFGDFKFAECKQDVTIYPVYLYKGDVNLIPVDNNSDGIINYYQVGGYSNPAGQAMVEIPASVNGIPVTEINDNAFSSFDGVHSIVVPNGIKVGKNAFTEGTKLGSGEEITIYFEGTKDQWNSLNKTTGWDYGIGTGSRVFFLKDGKVDATQGYLEVVGEGGFIGIGTKYSWKEKTDLTAVKNIYTGACNCQISTKGDTGHIYKDANGNVMEHNEAGTPVNANDKEIYFDDGGWFGEDKLTTDDGGTYYRYRLDAAYWEGVTLN